MESLTGVNTEEKTEVKVKSSGGVDRVTIAKAEFEKLGLWVDQVQKTSKGFLALTKSDLVNFLIRDHKLELSPKELTQIRTDNYDPIRHINWITQELKTALVKNDLAMVATLQDEIKGIELSVVLGAQAYNRAKADGLDPAPLKRKRRTKIEVVNPAESLSIADLQGDLPEA